MDTEKFYKWWEEAKKFVEKRCYKFLMVDVELILTINNIGKVC